MVFFGKRELGNCPVQLYIWEMPESVCLHLRAAREHLGDGKGWCKQKHPGEGLQLWLVGRAATRGPEEHTDGASL